MYLEFTKLCPEQIWAILGILLYMLSIIHMSIIYTIYGIQPFSSGSDLPVSQ